jgi:hypothetical protein
VAGGRLLLRRRIKGSAHGYGDQRRAGGIDAAALWQELLKRADKDGDGQISKSDFQAALGKSADSAATDQVFDAMDTNQDGFVSAAEYAAAMEKKGLMGQLFGQGQQGFSAMA